MPPSCRPSVTSCGVIFLLLCSLSSLSWPATAFTTPSLVPRNPLSRFLSAPALGVANLRDADFVEMMLGGERYEMVPLPDSMVETTLFVGNLNEFVKDDDLSNLFQTVSTLQYLPACVCRRPNRDSLKYGFVAFPTVEEKVTAILRFHGTSWKGKSIKVEEIRDDPKLARVRVPEAMVAYVSGAAKKTRSGRPNSLRRFARAETTGAVKSTKPNKKQRRTSSNNYNAAAMTIPRCNIYKLTTVEQQEFDRACRKGYVTLASTGFRRGRQANSLACMHRQWCDEREKPQIVLCKASGGRPLDNVIVDLSPMRMGSEMTDDFLVKWKAQIMTAANNACMELRSDYKEDNCETLSTLDDDEDEEEYDTDVEDVPSIEYVMTVTYADDWATQPIDKFPVLSMGVFEGERSNAKAMARELSELWGIQEGPPESDKSDFKKEGKNNRKGRDNRRRGRDHKIDFFF